MNQPLIHKTMKKMYVVIVLLCMVMISCDKEEADRIEDVNYNPELLPDNFTDDVTNINFPLIPGAVLSYTSQTAEGVETSTTTVLSETKTILGITCTIVHDVVMLDGVLIEDTHDWYAQDLDGNVWYMGEDVSNYEDGVFQDKGGSFEVGVDGAKPGIIMLADPVVELPYRQEYYFGEAEDWGKVVEKDVTVTTQYGTFQHCLKTEDWNALEPDEPVEFKYYAPGVGVVREEISGSDEFVELTDIE
jgi:hypothetical protein